VLLSGFFADLFFLPAFLKVFPQVLKPSPLPSRITTGIAMLLFAMPVWSQSAEDILKKSKHLIDEERRN
jgi:hypothetical protein